MQTRRFAATWRRAALLFIGLGQAGVGTAQAHVPHVAIDAVAIPADLSVDVPWFVLHTVNGSSTLFESEDGGDTWSARGADPLRDQILAAGRSTDGTTVMLSPTRYWYSSDDGASWADASFDAEGSVMAVSDVLVIGTADGLRFGAPGGILQAAAPGEEIRAVSNGPGGFAALGDSAWVGDGVTWQPITSPPGFATEILATTDAVYAGGSDGVVWRWSGTLWSECGATPYAGADHPSVEGLAVSGDELYVASASRGPARSADDCATWVDVAAPLDPEFGGVGDPETDAVTTTALIAYSGRLVEAGWNGIAWSDDDGESWSSRVVLPGDLSRGVAFSPNFENDGVILVGGYSGGLIRSEDWGARWAAPNLGLWRPNIQGVSFDPIDPRIAYADSNHYPARSDDQGVSWTSLEVPCSPCRGWTLDQAGGLWMHGTVVPDNPWGIVGNAALSRDHGVTWSEVEGLDSTVDWGAFMFTGARICVSDNTSRLACTSDRGATWRDVECGQAIDAVQEVGSAMVTVVDSLGIFVSTGGAPPIQTWDATDDPVYTLDQADDGTLFATTRGARLLRSDDVGRTWSDAGVDLPAGIGAVAIREGYAAHQEVLLATYDGAFLYVPGTGIRRFGQVQAIDDAGGWVVSDGARSLHDPLAALGTCTVLGEQTSIWTQVRGENVRLLGSAGGASQALLEIDGATTLIGATAVGMQGVLYSSGTLADAWHTVSLLGLQGDDLCIDSILGSTPADGLPRPDSGDTDSDTETGRDSDTSPAEDSSDSGNPQPPGGARPGCGGCEVPGSGPAQSAEVALIGLIGLSFGRRRRPVNS